MKMGSGLEGRIDDHDECVAVHDLSCRGGLGGLPRPPAREFHQEDFYKAGAMKNRHLVLAEWICLFIGGFLFVYFILYAIVFDENPGDSVRYGVILTLFVWSILVYVNRRMDGRRMDGTPIEEERVEEKGEFP